jgi:hypothetical protein
MTLKCDFPNGLIETTFPVTEEMCSALDREDWKTLDQLFIEASSLQGLLRNFLQQYLAFEGLEHIIAIRSAPDDEDGIWHDDGSRILGFSLSLTRNHECVVGGHLEFKKKDEQTGLTIKTRPLGTILLFLTGVYGYEHRVTAVTSGRRIVIAGWCQ